MSFSIKSILEVLFWFVFLHVTPNKKYLLGEWNCHNNTTEAIKSEQFFFTGMKFLYQNLNKNFAEKLHKVISARSQCVPRATPKLLCT